ncbi:MAG: VOC family protein [Dehalococcoidia bacterium]
MAYRTTHIMVFVSDMPRAIQFYREALGMSGIVTSPEFPDYVELPTEGATVSLMRPADEWPEGKTAIGRTTGITLTVSDLDGLYRTLSEKGVRFSRAPTKEPWGGIMTSFFDPDGNEISLLDEGSLRGGGWD